MTATAAVYLTALTGAVIVGLPRLWSWWRWNSAGRSATHFEVVRAGNGPEDFATAETDLNTFGRQVSVNHPARAGFGRRTPPVSAIDHRCVEGTKRGPGGTSKGTSARYIAAETA